MASKAKILTEFFKKVEADEKILRSKFPQIFGILQAGSVPRAVLDNYMAARADVQARMAFTRDLMRRYADPKTGQSSPNPEPLPAFFTKAGLNLSTMSPSTLISGKDVEFDAPPVPEGGGQLGNPLVIVAVIGATLVITSIAAKFIIDAAQEQEVKLAEQAVELEKQRNFARVWDTAQKLISQCVGANPTPEVIAKCWDNVVARFPDVVAKIPEHKLSSDQGGMGFFGKLGLAAATVGAVVVGVWGYRKWTEGSERRAARAEERSWRREEHEAKMSRTSGPAAQMQGLPPRRRRADLGTDKCHVCHGARQVPHSTYSTSTGFIRSTAACPACQPTIKVGDRVSWTSSSAGVTRKKDGYVVEVVPGGSRPKKMSNAVGTRHEESYVIRARARGTITESEKLYWPDTDRLKPEA